MNDALVASTRQLVEVLGEALAEISAGLGGEGTPRVDGSRWRHDAALEAFNLACAFVAADGRTTDDELWALLGAFGPLLETRLAGATPAALRESRLVEAQRGFLDRPSPLLEVLLAADARQGTTWARRYHDLAADVGFAVAAVDLHTSRSELEAIERFRAMVLGAIAERGRTPGSGSAASSAPPPAGSPVQPDATAEGDDAGPRPLDELLAELDGLIGLDEVKHEVRLVVDLLRVQRIRAERGLPTMTQSRHLVFTGNPGTGKTTVARLLAQIYRTLGVVERGHLVETDRAGLVAGYVGQTAPLVAARFDEADQGVLLIDEAYALVRGGERDFGREAIDAIVKLVEDRRDRVVVIMAGYPEEMEELIEANPGLRSRFPKVIHFPDYSTDELLAIIDSIGASAGYHLSPGARARARIWLDAVPRGRGFGNGRTARNLFEHAVATHASRVAGLPDPTDEQLTTLVADDIPMPGQGPVTTTRRR